MTNKKRRVRVEFEYDSDYARAVNARYGKEGEAHTKKCVFGLSNMASRANPMSVWNVQTLRKWRRPEYPREV